MNFARFLSIDSINMEIDAAIYDSIEEDFYAQRANRQRKKAILEGMADLLAASGKVKNVSKLRSFLIYNEQKNSSAIGDGVAIPHARCMQTRNLTVGFARCLDGVDFDAPDEEKVRLFITMTAPPYDDKLYLRIYRAIAKAFLETDVKEQLLSTNSPGEIIRIFNRYFI